MPLLQINDLRTYFYTDSGVVRAIDGVSLTLERGEVLGVVGGSGSGKTMLALSILRLVPEPGRVVSGQIIFEGDDLLKAPPPKLRAVRGGKISMIFQEPMTALNPVYTIGNQIAEAIRTHGNPPPPPLSVRGDQGGLVTDLLASVGLKPDTARRYPHELSGGMRQRAMIAMAIASNPALLIADEPTTALDVTTQAGILKLLDDLKNKTGMALLFITHDLGIVAGLADRVLVMNKGRIVEEGRTEDIFVHPREEYTKRLLAAVPVL